MLKVPPFGKELFSLQKQNLTPDYSIFLFIGTNAWQRAALSYNVRPNRTLMLPPWLCPSDYLLPVLQCRVLVIDTSFAEAHYLDDLAFCLFKAGATHVFCNQPDANFIIFDKDIQQ